MGYRAREQVSLFLSTGSARAGLAMLIILTAISLYVVATYPLDFGVRYWNNPAFWADYPKAAPPAWITLITGEDAYEHRVLRLNSPTSRSGGEDIYEFRFRIDSDSLPSFLALSVRGITYSVSPPVLVAELHRPDGSSITLLRHVVPGPRIGESRPYTRYFDTPLRLQLGGDPSTRAAVQQFLIERYGLALPAREIKDKFVSIILGEPQRIGSEVSFRALKGEYVFRLRFVSSSAEDRLLGVKLVVAGTVFGAMGTDSLGRDIAVGLLFGFPVALFIGIVASTLSTIVGTALGIVSGYVGGAVDLIIQRLSDIVANIPLLPILIFLSFIFRPNLIMIILILVAFSWPGLTIIVRSMVLQAKSNAFVEAAEAIGASKLRIMVYHVFPQIAPFIISQMIFFVPSAILAEAALSFLGLGDPTIPTWGQILELGFRTGGVFTGYWWWILPPGLLIVMTAMTFVFLALGMEPLINPRLREAR